MIKKLYLLSFLSLSVFVVYSQDTSTKTEAIQIKDTLINDGPYVFINHGQLIEKDIVNSKVTTKVLNTTAYDTLYPQEASTFSKVSKMAVFSDIHGQYQLAVDILKNNQVIDAKLNWNFGTGHLVIVGDVFDRGDKVNEMLWLIYKLEQQAKQQGGYVHYLLGNHEYMILHQDLRYVNKKYTEAATLLGTDYTGLYGKNTVIGRWLRSKPTLIKINNTVFVHGGVSQAFLDKTPFDIAAINATMSASIDRSKDDMKATDFYSTYYGSTGPIWYRGYFYDPITDAEMDHILTQTHLDHIIVGHCSNDEVVGLYNQRIFGVDSSIKKGMYGEILFIIDGRYYRGTKEGKRIPF